jgi:hypothetical protein
MEDDTSSSEREEEEEGSVLGADDDGRTWEWGGTVPVTAQKSEQYQPIIFLSS